MNKYQSYSYKNNKLREYRKRAGLLQIQLAKELGFNGIDRISYWENGSAIPNLPNLLKLCVLLRTTPFDLYPDLLDEIQDEIENRDFIHSIIKSSSKN